MHEQSTERRKICKAKLFIGHDNDNSIIFFPSKINMEWVKSAYLQFERIKWRNHIYSSFSDNKLAILITVNFIYFDFLSSHCFQHIVNALENNKNRNKIQRSQPHLQIECNKKITVQINC